MTETFTSINLWQRETFPDATSEGILNHIEEEITEFKDAPTLEAKRIEAGDLIILLSAWLDATKELDDIHSGAQTVVDAKMTINRARNWDIQSDGTGRHV